MNKSVQWSAVLGLLALLLASCGTSRTTQVTLPKVQGNNAYNRYIEQYAGIALQNQRNFGIPASITLAQGLLESGAGQSKLATGANNHFGIKCHRAWRGSRTFHNDDRPNECFRAYDRVEDSFKDHGQFLQQPRYRSLQRLEPTDYKGWARGLQKAGYATDRGYANKLIKIIEDYQLYLIDEGNTSRRYQYAQKSAPKREVEQKPRPDTGERVGYFSYGLLYILAGEDDSLSAIARDLGMSERKLTEYNDLPAGYPLEKGDIIYLEPKHKRATPPHFEHRIQVGESIHRIAQTYGIQLESLYKLNNLTPEYLPMEGDILRLR
ncbi:glucosaminidase domain-containing protein [uncultured Porphyromonas sp.]|uniref:glucosaminidase domain-containing protein n=2 Tax=uncultured Porphyromonas sp. TaxID=159274 RepID=UPI0026111715|nr:glucosaminidase domain-containing protein [uncultured Porphyromonas sp.]